MYYTYTYQAVLMDRNLKPVRIIELDMTDNTPEMINGAIRYIKNKAKSLDLLICKTKILKVREG